MTLHEIAKKLMQDGKGIFIADEYPGSLNQLFVSQNISTDDESLRTYRELLVTTEGIERLLSAVVLSQDALLVETKDGTPLHELLASKEILVGTLIEAKNENARQRIHELRSLSVTFGYIRLEAHIGAGPTSDEFKDSIRFAVETAQHMHAEDIVPILGVDTHTDGPHTAGQAEDYLVESLSLLSDALESSGLDLKGVIVATGFAATGLQNPTRVDSKEVAERTVRAITSSLPERIGGVVFLSGEELPENASAHLNFVSRLEPFAWPVTFFFSQAFNVSALSVWKGTEENSANAQSAFLSRISLTESADAAGYASSMEDGALDRF